MLALNSLSMALVYCVESRMQMALIRSPSIGIELGNPKRFQQSFQLTTRYLDATIRHKPTRCLWCDQWRARASARPFYCPQSSTSHRLRLRRPATGKDSPQFESAQFLSSKLHSQLGDGGLFFNVSITVVGLIFKTLAVSLMPLPLSAMSAICCLTSGK